jgi:hypothetical protein
MTLRDQSGDEMKECRGQKPLLATSFKTRSFLKWGIPPMSALRKRPVYFANDRTPQSAGVLFLCSGTVTAIGQNAGRADKRCVLIVLDSRKKRGMLS